MPLASTKRKISLPRKQKRPYPKPKETVPGALPLLLVHSMAFETHLIVAEEVIQLAEHLLCRDEGPSSDASISVKAGPGSVPVSPVPGREAEARDFLTSQPS